MGKGKDGKKDGAATADGDKAKTADKASAKAAKKAKRAAGDGRLKAKKPKPRGMRWVNPYLTVRDVEASLAWYEKAFGFKTSFTLPGPDGKPIHAEMTHRKSVVMLGPEANAYSRAPGKDGSPVSLYCYCADVDAVAAAARAAGAKVVEEPQDQFWGDRTCFLVDPDGHQWTFATHVFDLDPNAPPPTAACGEAACAESAAATTATPEAGKKDGGSTSPAPGIETALGAVPAKT